MAMVCCSIGFLLLQRTLCGAVLGNGWKAFGHRCFLAVVSCCADIIRLGHIGAGDADHDCSWRGLGEGRAGNAYRHGAASLGFGRFA